MIKVVYNSCFGGYSVSREAVEWLSEHGGKDATAELTEFDEMVEDDPSYADYEDFRLDELPRHDPLFVECVEELGKKASGSYADLRIAKVEGNQYRIHEYDGSESVRTPAGMRWVEVPGIKPTRHDWLLYCAKLHDAGLHNEAEELSQLAFLAWDRISDEDVKTFWAAVDQITNEGSA